MSLLDRIDDCARPGLSGLHRLMVGQTPVGYLDPALAGRLARYPDVFQEGGGRLSLAPALATPAARTKAVAGVLRELADDGLVPGWRDEIYPVAATWGAPALFAMERAAVPLFGVIGYGVHLNGLVRKAGETLMWVGRRAMTKPTGAGQLDQIVAGGQPAGIGVMDNLIKEAHEEAGIPEDRARQAKPVGTVTYCTRRPEGLRRDLLFVYDLELPDGFTPCNMDGEVEAFYRWPLERVKEVLAEGRDFKFNCALVAIGCLLREGLIAADDADYVALSEGLHAPL